MICPNCRHKNRDDSEFCASCGKELPFSPKLKFNSNRQFGNNIATGNDTNSATNEVKALGDRLAGMISRFQKSEQPFRKFLMIHGIIVAIALFVLCICFVTISGRLSKVEEQLYSVSDGVESVEASNEPTEEPISEPTQEPKDEGTVTLTFVRGDSISYKYVSSSPAEMDKTLLNILTEEFGIRDGAVSGLEYGDDHRQIDLDRNLQWVDLELGNNIELTIIWNNENPQ